MRVTYLRSAKGDQIIIPNGTITRVINYNKGTSVASITVSTAYESDTRKVHRAFWSEQSTSMHRNMQSLLRNLLLCKELQSRRIQCRYRNYLQGKADETVGSGARNAPLPSKRCLMQTELDFHILIWSRFLMKSRLTLSARKTSLWRKKDLHQDLESWQQVDADAVDI